MRAHRSSHQTKLLRELTAKLVLLLFIATCATAVATFFAFSNSLGGDRYKIWVSEVREKGAVPRSRVLKATMHYGKSVIRTKANSSTNNITEQIGLALATHTLYDQRHGYESAILEREIYSNVWSKTAFLLELMLSELQKPDEERKLWLMWFDADTIITNPEIPLETFLPPSSQFDHINAIVTKDHNGLNNGVFFIKVCDWSVTLLSSILAFRHFHPNVPLRFRDQTAMAILLEHEAFAPSVVYVPTHWFNAFPADPSRAPVPRHWRSGSLLVHLVGAEHKQNFSFWLDVANHAYATNLAKPVSQTFYRSEVEAFWLQTSSGFQKRM